MTQLRIAPKPDNFDIMAIMNETRNHDLRRAISSFGRDCFDMDKLMRCVR